MQLVPYGTGTDPTMLLALLCDKFIDDAFPLAEELGDYLELLAHSVGRGVVLIMRVGRFGSLA